MDWRKMIRDNRGDFSALMVIRASALSFGGCSIDEFDAEMSKYFGAPVGFKHSPENVGHIVVDDGTQYLASYPIGVYDTLDAVMCKAIRRYDPFLCSRCGYALPVPDACHLCV